MKRAMYLVLYLVLAAVVLSCFRSVWIGLADTVGYQRAFPGAQGVLFGSTLLVSFLAGLNAIFIGLHKRWAIFVNPLIGLASIILIEIVQGPRTNELVVFVACLLSTVMPWYLWGRQAPRSN